MKNLLIKQEFRKPYHYHDQPDSHLLPIVCNLAIKINDVLDADPVICDVWGRISWYEKGCVDDVQIAEVTLTNTDIDLTGLLKYEYLEELAEWIKNNDWEIT